MQADISKNPVPDNSSNLSKKEQVADMFNNIACKYDFLNHFLSLGIDKGWRRKTIKAIGTISPQKILDVATGTGDLAIAATVLNPQQIIGIDIAEQMMQQGRKKIEAKNLSHIIHLQYGDSELLNFADNNFNAITCAFGVRNFEHLDKGLAEMYRVMHPGGRLAILEFSKPKKFPVKQIFQIYFRYLLPLIGKIVSKHRSAYTYLPESVMAFPEGKAFCKRLENAGFVNSQAQPLTFGIASLYTAHK